MFTAEMPGMVVFVSTPMSEALTATGHFRMNPAGVQEFRHRSCHSERCVDMSGFVQTVSQGRRVDKVTETHLAQGHFRSTPSLLVLH